MGRNASGEFPLDVREAGSTAAAPAVTTEAGATAVATAGSPSLTSTNLMQLDLGSFSPTGSVSLIDEVPARSGASVGPGDGNVSEEGGGRAASASGGGGGEGMAPGGRGDGMAPEGGGGGSGRTRCRGDTLKSEGSTEDECSHASAVGASGGRVGASTAAAHSHYAHWENFTNNDIVDQVRILYKVVSFCFLLVLRGGLKWRVLPFDDYIEENAVLYCTVLYCIVAPMSFGDVTVCRNMICFKRS